jgi:hypothetical protein
LKPSKGQAKRDVVGKIVRAWGAILSLEEEMGNVKEVKGWGKRDDAAMLMGWLRVSVKGLKISEIACKGMLAVNGWIAII